MPYKLSNRSLERLNGVHPEMVAVVKLAITISAADFMVVEGLRALETQKRYVAEGKSQTLKSKHLRQPDGFGHAVDLCGYAGGKALWDWPTLRKINDAMQEAAKKLGVKLTWGGNWKSFKDGPHFQLEG